MAQHTVIWTLRLYRATLSPVLGFVCGGLGLGCRFSPTCSQYALEAVQRHGVVRGLWLAIMRLCRCHPWGGSGYDPVPLKEGRGEPCLLSAVGKIQGETHGS